MYYVSNTLATRFAFFTILFYIVIYTFWLKRTTSLNIVIGGAAGAIPPIIGWATVIPEISYFPICDVFNHIFWTPLTFGHYQFIDLMIMKK